MIRWLFAKIVGPETAYPHLAGEAVEAAIIYYKGLEASAVFAEKARRQNHPGRCAPSGLGTARDQARTPSRAQFEGENAA